MLHMEISHLECDDVTWWWFSWLKRRLSFKHFVQSNCNNLLCSIEFFNLGSLLNVLLHWKWSQPHVLYKIIYHLKWEGNDKPLQYSCLRNPMDRGAWLATIHRVAKELDTTEWLKKNKHLNIFYLIMSFTNNCYCLDYSDKYVIFVLPHEKFISTMVNVKSFKVLSFLKYCLLINYSFLNHSLWKEMNLHLVMDYMFAFFFLFFEYKAGRRQIWK